MWMCRTEGQESQQRRLRKRGTIVRRLLGDERGTTAIEFAVVGPVVVYLMIGIIEFAVAMAAANSLEAATNLSSRLGKTGYVDEENLLTQEQTILAEVERRVGPLINMDKLEISHEVYNDFQSLTIPDLFEDANGDGDTDDPGEWTDVDGDGFRDGSNGIGGAGHIVVYRVTYPWKVMTPMIGQIIGARSIGGDDGIINLSAYSVVKNEPY
ncbi:TadE/TadG family type IV pilus assembly protein [Dongia deserti]|uniref:TadE/TadG family type IV pilus assembly protein n=1 Tax=Dongia deserti TaxID=2268030 RepID=UPI0013C4AE1E|nr:TadE/TadG family type IV pilus assembly protein [Dongia deserti]